MNQELFTLVDDLEKLVRDLEAEYDKHPEATGSLERCQRIRALEQRVAALLPKQ